MITLRLDDARSSDNRQFRLCYLHPRRVTGRNFHSVEESGAKFWEFSSDIQVHVVHLRYRRERFFVAANDFWRPRPVAAWRMVDDVRRTTRNIKSAVVAMVTATILALRMDDRRRLSN